MLLQTIIYTASIACGLLPAQAFARPSPPTNSTCGWNSEDGIARKGYSCLKVKGSGCCSQHGWCGDTEAYCGIGCQSKFGRCSSNSTSSSTVTPKVSQDGRCGRGWGYTCKGSNFGDSCSSFGYCGRTEMHSSVQNGCQQKYGWCDGHSDAGPTESGGDGDAVDSSEAYGASTSYSAPSNPSKPNEPYHADSHHTGSTGASSPSAPQPNSPQTYAPQQNTPGSNAPQPNAPGWNAPQPNAPGSNAPQPNAPQPNAPQPNGHSKPNVDTDTHHDPLTGDGHQYADYDGHYGGDSHPTVDDDHHGAGASHYYSETVHQPSIAAWSENSDYGNAYSSNYHYKPEGASTLPAKETTSPLITPTEVPVTATPSPVQPTLSISSFGRYANSTSTVSAGSSVISPSEISSTISEASSSSMTSEASSSTLSTSSGITPESSSSASETSSSTISDSSSSASETSSSATSDASSSTTSDASSSTTSDAFSSTTSGASSSTTSESSSSATITTSSDLSSSTTSSDVVSSTTSSDTSSTTSDISSSITTSSDTASTTSSDISSSATSSVATTSSSPVPTCGSIPNAGFESPSATPNWVIVSQSGSVSVVNGYAYSGAAEGSKVMYASLTSPGSTMTVGNTFSSLGAGVDYTVTMQCRKNSGLQASLVVDGVTYNTIPTGGDTSWRSYQFTFTANSDTAAFTMPVSIIDSADGVMFDAFTIAPASGVCTS